MKTTTPAKPTRQENPALAGAHVSDRGAAVLFDWLKEPYGITKPNYELFAQPASAPRSTEAQVRGYQQTNMLAPNRLIPPRGFLTCSLHCFYGPMTEADREQFRAAYTLDFWISNKTFYRCP